MRLKYIFSIISGTISALALAYLMLAPVWNLPASDKVFTTAGVIAMVLSILLSVITGKKLAKELSPNSMLDSIKSGTVFESEDTADKTYSDGNAMSEEKAAELYAPVEPTKGRHVAS